MPPLRSDRAPRACETCRRLKTRCYPSRTNLGSCLRCETQDRTCSLTTFHQQHHRSPLPGSTNEVRIHSLATTETTVEQRLAKLESVVHTLVDKLDALAQQPHTSSGSREPSLERSESSSSPAEHNAPVILIKDIADGVRADQQHYSATADGHKGIDPITRGIIELQDAYELLSIFRLHYGRWVNFDEESSLEELMLRVRASPLLFNSICLVAARHTISQRTNSLAPTFFREAKNLLQVSLLKTPQTIEFFQAALVLSFWSTSIGQIPLSIDSWLLTSYTLQQGIGSSMTIDLKESAVDNDRLRAACTWNHICLSHLQYCAGMGRQSLLHKAQIDRCADVLNFEVSQFEIRMVAELKLYWIIVSRCCAPSVNLSVIRTALRDWREEWSFLFGQPRSQFLQMGYEFALLLAHCRLLHSQRVKLSYSKLNEMVESARTIINLAMTHTDERTPHLTDHIYHLITFSAIILIQLLAKYPTVLGNSNDVDALHGAITDLVHWLRSVGLASHIGHVLADIIATHHASYSDALHSGPQQGCSRNASSGLAISRGLQPEPLPGTGFEPDSHDAGVEFPFQDYHWTTFFDFNADTASWLQGSELIGTDVTPSTQSWTASAYAGSP